MQATESTWKPFDQHQITFWPPKKSKFNNTEPHCRHGEVYFVRHIVLCASWFRQHPQSRPGPTSPLYHSHNRCHSAHLSVVLMLWVITVQEPHDSAYGCTYFKRMLSKLQTQTSNCWSRCLVVVVFYFASHCDLASACFSFVTTPLSPWRVHFLTSLSFRLTDVEQTPEKTNHLQLSITLSGWRYNKNVVSSILMESLMSAEYWLCLNTDTSNCSHNNRLHNVIIT